MKFHGNFIGENYSNCVRNDNGTDTGYLPIGIDIQKFAEWNEFFNKNPVTYSYNKFGHRCKNLEDIDLSNYVLFTGCSHTLGCGIPISATYPYSTSKLLQCDYYNLAVTASGIDVLIFNLVSWFATVTSTPRAVVIQFPSPDRFATISGDRIRPRGPSWDTDLSILNSIVLRDICGIADTTVTLAKKMIKLITQDKCPIYSVGAFKGVIEPDSVLFSELDKAKDFLHYGIKSNNQLSQDLVKYMSAST